MRSKRAEAIGQFDLFSPLVGSGAGSGLLNVPVPEQRWDTKQQRWDTKQQLALERDVLGLYVSGHPLECVAHILARQTDTAIASITEGAVVNGAQVIVGGILGSVNRRVNRHGEPWVSAQLADLAAGIEVLLFPTTYAVVGVNVVEDAIVLVKARVARSDDRISLIVTDLIEPDLAEPAGM